MEFLNFKKKIEISFYSITIFFTFYTYTFYAIISKNYNLLFTFITIFLYIIFYKIYRKSNLKINLTILNWEILAFFLLLIVGFVLNFQDLKYSLYGDEFANALRTQRTSIYSSFLFLKTVDVPLLKNISFNNVVHLFSFFELLFFLTISYLIFKKKNIYTIILLILITLIFRYFLKDFGMHPPVNHFFSFILTSLFGFKDYVFRFSYFLIYLVGNVFLLNQLNKFFNNKLHNLLIVLFIFTVPISLLSSTNIDHSIWGNVFLINFLVYFYFNKKLNYEIIVLLISIFSMARITNFILILPILYSYIAENKNSLNIKKIFFTFFPTIFFLPFILKLFLLGSNVHSSGFANIYFQVFQSLKSNLFLKSAFFFIPNYIYFFSFIGFLIFIIKERVFKKILPILLTFLFYLIIYSSISKNWIGHPKYIFEYIIPFLMFFFIISAKYYNKFLPILLIILIPIGVYNFTKSSKTIYLNPTEDKKFQIRKRYNFKDAYKAIKKKQLHLSNLKFGVYYGFVTEILNNYKFNELLIISKRNFKIKNDLNAGYNLKTFFNFNKEINSIIIDQDDYIFYKHIFSDWSKIQVFYYSDYKNNKLIHLMK